MCPRLRYGTTRRPAVEETVYSFGKQLGLVLEVTVEATAGKAGLCHDRIDADIGEAVAVEQDARRFDHVQIPVRVSWWQDA